jgi:hypothetical protein
MMELVAMPQTLLVEPMEKHSDSVVSKLTDKSRN